MFKLSNAALLLGLVVRLIVHTNDIIGLLQTGAILVCAVFIVFSFSVGYLLGGPGIDTQRVLGVGTAQRNFAAALLVATSNFEDPSVVSIIMVTSILMMIVYSREKYHLKYKYLILPVSSVGSFVPQK